MAALYQDSPLCRRNLSGWAQLLLVACLLLPAFADPLGAQLVMDAFDYPDDPSARAAWTPRAGSPEVETADSGPWGNERVMRLPCDFSVLDGRCYWDRSVSLDLSTYREFALEVFVPDPGAISYLTLYFHAGAGWYANGVGITRPGWQTLYFSVIDFEEEDAPAGWDQIDTIRLSPWEEADRDTWLAVRELRAFTPLVFIVRDTQTADDRTVDNTTQLLSQWLGRYNVSLGVIDDAAVEQGYLAGSRMAILPYNDVVSAQQMTRYESFVASGGKLMVFYLMRSRLDDLLGFQPTGWTQGNFASYVFADSLIEHLPERVSQDSWNITTAAPGPGLNARVIATWEDSTGASTGQPAWLAGDNGLFHSHILLPDDAETKQFTLLVLIGHYVPEIWPAAAAAAIENVGRIAEYLGYGEAVADIRARGAATPRAAQVEKALACAEEALQEAISLADGGGYPEAVLAAARARSHLLEAYTFCQSPIEPEFRAVWEHSGTGPYPGDWTDAADILAANGFTAVFPNMLWGGLAHYDSALLPHSQEYDTYGDQITACVDASHARGVEVHVWKVNWNLSGAPQTFVDAMRAADRTQVSWDGQPGDWLCPSHPQNFALERDAMLEVVADYDVDGIHFDYIRYPNSSYCYCDGCRARFEGETGNAVSSWPADVRGGGPLESAFLDWRRLQITELVEAVYQGAKALKPDVQVSAAVFSSYAYAYDGVGQDWVDWIDRGIIDFLCPMDYTEDYDRFRDLVAEQMTCAAGRIPIYPGIGATASSSALGPDAVIAQILATRRAGTGGFIVFNYEPEIAARHLPALGMATTAPVGGVSPWARLEASMDVTATGIIRDPDPPRPINPGDGFGYRILLVETSGVEDATDVRMTIVLDDPCFDLSSFDVLDVAVSGSTALVGWFPNGQSLIVYGFTIPAGGTVSVEISDLHLSTTALCTRPCARAEVTWLSRPGNAQTRGRTETEDPETADCDDATCMLVHPKTYLRRGGADPSLCPLAARPDLDTVFPLPPVLFVDLPYEDAGYGLPAAHPGSPAGNSCLLFYQVDEVDRILLVRDASDPAAALRVEAF